MSSRRRGRGNRRARLEKAMTEQRALESELEKLNSAEDQQKRAQEIRDFIVKNGEDPMIAEDNPFKQNTGGGCCTIL